MSTELCYLCQTPAKSGQSWYEDHGVRVCLSCFRKSPRCSKCKFPSNSMTMIQGLGQICEFCKQDIESKDSSTCYLCAATIWEGMSHYADHGKIVCQNCFKDAPIRCFTCRFPKVSQEIPGLGGICEFCKDDLVSSQTKISGLIQPLLPFIESYGHKPNPDPRILWMDWQAILGMQHKDPTVFKIKFFDELILYCYPIFYSKEVVYIIPRIPRDWFFPCIASQLAASDLCKTYNQPHLLGDSPFHETARGWCHWIAYSTAKALRYEKIQKKLSRYPDTRIIGTFPKFLAMEDFRKPPEILKFGQNQIRLMAQKYL